MARVKTSDEKRLDDAARAGWLYYVAGNNQEEIAAKLGISRQTAQRLVSLAISEGLIKVRLDHPIARCLDLAQALEDRFKLERAEIVPTDPASTSATIGIAEAGAAEIERTLRAPEPSIMAIGTGRTLKATVDQLSPIDAPQHRIVSLAGNVAPDGSASYYNVIYGMAEAVKARLFPMPLPVIVSSPAERELLHRQPLIHATLMLAAEANATFVGIGDLGDQAPLYLDGFVSADELKALQMAGAVGEITGWAFDRDGQLITGLTNERVASAPIPPRQNRRVIAIAKGQNKLLGIFAALRGCLVNGLITDEETANLLLNLK